MSPSTRVLNESEPSAPLGCGRIDIHSHLLPGLDDGCTDVSESLACVQHLIKAGYDGSICTPHVWPDYYPQNTAAHIEKWTRQLQVQIQNAGLAYQLWPGGELRLFDGMIEWMQAHGIPTLAGSRCVLLDHWGEHWPKSINRDFQWLLDRGYQPILAHPERLVPSSHLDRNLSALCDMGVWMQGNSLCMTGVLDPYIAAAWEPSLLFIPCSLASPLSKGI